MALRARVLAKGYGYRVFKVQKGIRPSSIRTRGELVRIARIEYLEDFRAP